MAQHETFPSRHTMSKQRPSNVHYIQINCVPARLSGGKLSWVDVLSKNNFLILDDYLVYKFQVKSRPNLNSLINRNRPLQYMFSCLVNRRRQIKSKPVGTINAVNAGARVSVIRKYMLLQDATGKTLKKGNSFYIKPGTKVQVKFSYI